jgi:hypothetical protein
MEFARDTTTLEHLARLTLFLADATARLADYFKKEEVQSRVRDRRMRRRMRASATGLRIAERPCFPVSA